MGSNALGSVQEETKVTVCPWKPGMKLMQPLEGRYVSLRTAEESDAEFILSLRLDPKLSRFLKKTDPNVEKQRDWIRSKIAQEGDYHMIVEDTGKGEPVGVIAIYDIRDGVFEIGRWIIEPGKPVSVAIESFYLAYRLAFDELGLQVTESKVRLDNRTVLEFHQRYGAELMKSDDLYAYVRYDRNAFQSETSFFRRYGRALGFLKG